MFQADVTTPSTIDIADEFLTPKSVSFLYGRYINSVGSQGRNSSGIANGLMGKSLKNPVVNCSKSLFACASRVNLPPAIHSPLVQFPPPLTVMGYRPDQQKQVTTQTKCPRNTNNNKNISLNYMRCIPKYQSCKWKAKLPINCSKIDDLYQDPLVNGDPDFMQRISEMASLEVETIKDEKARRFRRK